MGVHFSSETCVETVRNGVTTSQYNRIAKILSGISVVIARLQNNFFASDHAFFGFRLGQSKIRVA